MSESKTGSVKNSNTEATYFRKFYLVVTKKNVTSDDKNLKQARDQYCLNPIVKNSAKF